jgi:hypothetical protein
MFFVKLLLKIELLFHNYNIIGYFIKCKYKIRVLFRTKFYLEERYPFSQEVNSFLNIGSQFIVDDKYEYKKHISSGAYGIVASGKNKLTN